MTLVQLEYVLAVAESKNFTLAAEKVHVTQPTLSMQIQKLESELGIEIFDRSTHPIKITNVGKAVLDQAQKVLSEAKRMELMVSEQRKTVEGEFVVGVIPTLITTLIPMIYKNFIHKFPKARLVIKELRTEDIMLQLKEDKIDFGIAVTPLVHNDFIEQVLFYEPLVGYVPPENRLSQKQELEEKDLEHADLLILEEGHCFRNNVLSICSTPRGEDGKVAVETGSLEAIVKLVDEGLGMTVLPVMQAEALPEESKRNIKQFKSPVPTREVSLIYYHTQLRLTFAQELQKLIKSIVRGEIYLKEGKKTLPTLSMKK